MSSVHCNRHRETCIVVKVERGKVHFVTMRSGAIDLETMGKARFMEEFCLALPYPVRAAARRYLASYLPPTPRAARALRSLLHA